MKKISLLLFGAFAAFGTFAQNKSKPNILFIAVDDLKPELGCYGNKLIKTPNIDRLAKMGTVFLNNYCQQAVCGPTRASLMTGLRPDETKVWDLKTKMRDVNPDIVTLPQYLITQGYTTSGVGKIFHPSCADKKFDEPSWSIPFLTPKASDYANGLGFPAKKHYQSPETKAAISNEAPSDKDKKGDDDESTSGTVKPSTECLDLPDDAYEDGVSALIAKKSIIELSKEKKPFFFAVGFRKPHLPFVSPKKYWDLYKREDMPIAEFQEHAADGPFIAYESSGELRNYTDIPAFTTHPKEELRAGLKIEKQKELIHGYYAAISYVDAQIGILLNTLDSLGTLNNTVIVLWGDHGWHLGDHDMWGKHTNFEQATRSPLIFAGPGLKGGGQSKSLTEHVDVFPTICDLANLPIPNQLQGKSLKPVMQNNKASVKEFSISQYPRKLKGTEAKTLGYTDGKLMGYSIRTERYRYTLWLNNSFTSKQPYDDARVYAKEMYDYVKDPLEKVNVADKKEYEKAATDLKKSLIEYLKSQEAK
jgi:arylsulfatase A-like enzyme